jgi:hypothetical protein
MWRPSAHLQGSLLLRLQDLAQLLGLVAIKASDGIMGGGGGRSLLPVAPNLL